MQQQLPFEEVSKKKRQLYGGLNSESVILMMSGYNGSAVHLHECDCMCLSAGSTEAEKQATDGQASVNPRSLRYIFC